MLSVVEPDGTRWRTGGEVKGKLETTVTLPRNVVYPALLKLMRTHWLPAVNWTDASFELNGLVRFDERRNLVSTRVPSRFKRTLPPFRENYVSVPLDGLICDLIDKLLTNHNLSSFICGSHVPHPWFWESFRHLRRVCWYYWCQNLGLECRSSVYFGIVESFWADFHS